MNVAAASLISKVEQPVTTDRIIDENVWRGNVVDLHRVMTVAKMLYIALEHHNEAIVRVAIEIVTCEHARKCLWWDDNWYANDEKRESFKKTVKEKLSFVVAGVKRQPVVLTEADDRGDAAATGMLLKQLEEAQAAAKAAARQQQLAEMRCRELETEITEANSMVASLQKTVEQMRIAARRAEIEDKENIRVVETVVEKVVERVVERDVVREVLVPAPGDDGKMSKRLAELEQQLKAKSEENRLLSQKYAQQLKAANEKGDELARMRLRIKEFEAAAQAKPEDPEREAGPPQPERDGELEAELASAQQREAQLEADLTAERRRSAGLEEDLLGTSRQLKTCQGEHHSAVEQIIDIQEQLAACRLELCRCKDELAAARAEGLRAREPGEPGLSAELAKELEELRRTAGEFEKMKAKLIKRQSDVATLREEKHQLEEEREMMLKTLQQLRRQLQRLREIAEKKGYGKVVGEILNEAGVTGTLLSPEFDCFNRLYDDAIRRMTKAKLAEQGALGISGSPLWARKPARVAWGAAHVHAAEAPAVATPGDAQWGGGWAVPQRVLGSPGLGASLVPGAATGHAIHMRKQFMESTGWHEIDQHDRGDSFRDAAPLHQGADFTVRQIPVPHRPQSGGAQRPSSAIRCRSAHQPEALQRPGTAPEPSHLMIQGSPARHSPPSLAVSPFHSAAAVSPVGSADQQPGLNARTKVSIGSQSMGALDVSSKRAQGPRGLHHARGGGWSRNAGRRAAG